MTMKQGVYTCVVGLVVYIQSALLVAKPFETVWLKDTTKQFQTDKRTLINIDFPDELEFHITRRADSLKLNLRRNHDINPNPDFYFARKLQNGQFDLVKSRNIEKEDVAYYQDIKNGAFMTVRCVKKSNEQCDRIINGNVRIGDRDYDLQPAETDLASRNMLEDQVIFDRQYVLQDQIHTRSEYSVEQKDADQKNDKDMKQKHMAVLRRSQEQNKQRNKSPTAATLCSQKPSIVHKRGETDKSRELPNVYFVKFAVLIDKGLWDQCYSTVDSSRLTRSRNTKRMIKQFYSHVLNGVNMLYKGIEDDSIRITVILSEFIIFKRNCDFHHERSNVVWHGGRGYIEDLAYLYDINSWDEKAQVRKNRTFSYGMLFTRYVLQESGSFGRNTNGLSYVGEVCNVRTRVGVAEKRGYVGMVHTAAHELGHSLGANHDGECEAVDCKSEDLFIMTAEPDKEHPDKPIYSKNRWLFSNCTINTFKVAMKNKTCLYDHGQYYDPEYFEHVKQEPGEVFGITEQCELIYGRGSILCETDISYICMEMRCTDPDTGRCFREYHGAARGTVCGRNKDQVTTGHSQVHDWTSKQNYKTNCDYTLALSKAK